MAVELTVVTGLPGALLFPVARELKEQGHEILWPGQTLDLHGDVERYKDGENPEVTRMHNALLATTGQTWFTVNSPQFYDPPCPGPEDILGQFAEGAKVVLADVRFCLFLPLWVAYLRRLVICDCSPEESAATMQRWWKGKVGLDDCVLVSHHYGNRLRTYASRIMERIELPSGDVRSGEFTRRLRGFLKNGF